MLIKFEPKVEHLKCVMLASNAELKLSRTMLYLLPGTNEVTDDEWKAMRPNITKELENGEIIILAQKVSAGRGKVGGVKAKDLKQMPVNIAVKYVSECNNPDTLTKWYAEITNEEVRLAVTKKFKKLGLELPEDTIPETPNGSPMTLEEFDEDESPDEETDDEMQGDDEDSIADEETDFSKMKVNELKAICEERGINTEGMKKEDLIMALENNSEEE